jgi:signal transduction histidine kinase
VARAAAVAAERAERRRIERDLHDGAQQQLIALGLALQLARRTADQAPDRCRQTLSAAADLAHRTAQELGRLSWSLYSAVTTASDLGAALQAAADRLPIAMTVTAAPPQAGRDLGPQCRMALYFVVLEAAQNAIKHAAAWSIQVRIEQAGDELRVSVTDDGRGFDPGASTAGTGLRQAAIRLGEVGGRLQVTSRPGAGSMLTATVPAAVPGAVSSVTP